MNIKSINEFADACGITYQAVLKKIEVGQIEPLTKNPYTIDADKYDFIIKYHQNK